jgi:hypothetical protein
MSPSWGMLRAMHKTPTPFTRSRRLPGRLLGALVPAALLLLSPVAFAQDPAPPAETPAPAPEAPAVPPEGAPPAAEPAPAPAPAANAALEDKVNALEGKVEGIAEPFSAMQSDVAALKRLKISGYIQGRYEWHDDADYGFRVDNGVKKIRETNRFYVRRGRLKTVYVGDFSEFLLQIDAVGDGVTLKDAEASLVLTNENPWMPSATPWEFKLTMGQFKVPFGFEVLQSSGDREMPERSAVIRALYPGERDRGVRLQYTYDWFKLMAAVINGNFTTDPDHVAFDQTSWKDIVGRVSADLDVVVISVSAHHGHFLKTVRQPTAAMPVAGYQRYNRLRLGADAQAYIDIPGLGGLTLRGETIWGKDTQMDFAEVAADPNKCNDEQHFGWIGTLVQNLGDHMGVVVRVDQYDPIKSLDDKCTNAARHTTADNDKVTDVGFGLLGFVSANLKVSAIYEHLVEQEAKKVGNDILTLQMQAKF